MPEINEQIIEKKIVVTSLPPGYTIFARIVYYLTDVIEIILGLRFIARAFGANPGNMFISFLYRISSALLAPFRGIFPTVQQSGVVLEWSTIVAMVIYALIAMLLLRLVRILLAR